MGGKSARKSGSSSHGDGGANGGPRHRAGQDAGSQELTQLTGDAEKAKLDIEEISDLTGDYGNVALLLMLYTLQGIPMGLSAVLPLILKERGVSFSDIATFSLNSWPFSLKIFWAPIVDAAFIKSIGRRKTWMVPAQFLIGLTMIGVSGMLDDLLFVEKPAIVPLTGLFFFLYFLCATQDIAVDGWALTMLRKENVGYAATCNSVGQTLGYTFGFTGYMVLEHFQLLTLQSFMYGWGVIFIIVTTFVAIFKSETEEALEDQPESIPEAYRQMLAIGRLKAVRQLILVLFTWKAGFAIVDGVAPLKLQEYGIPKEHMAYLTSALMPVYIALPLFVARWTAGPTPFDVALKAYPFRVALVPLTVILLLFTPSNMDVVPWAFYVIVLLVSLMGAVASQCMFVSQMAFFARVSDPAMGGTYMTLLNTLANLGGMWPPTATMFMIDRASCKTEDCIFKMDGFYVMAVVCFIAGTSWYIFGTGPARRLQHLKLDHWRVR